MKFVSIWSLPRKLACLIWKSYDMTDFPQAVIWKNYRVTFWTLSDPVMIEYL